MEKNNSPKIIKRRNIDGADIRVKESSLEWWKPTIDISDLFIVDNLYRWNLESVVYQDISEFSGVYNTIVVSYFDRDLDETRSRTVRFKFKRSKDESIEFFDSPDNFEINEEVFKSLNFANIKTSDVISKHPKFHVRSVSIKDWKLFDKIVLVSIIAVIGDSLEDPEGLEREITKVIKIDLDQEDLIASTLEVDKDNTLLRMNHDMEFEVKEFTPILNSYDKFFKESELKRFSQVIKKLEIINPRILVDEIDIFSTRATAGFMADILIGKTVKKDFVFEAQYNAQNLKNVISNYLNDLPLVNEIAGYPRDNLAISDVFNDWENSYFKSRLDKKGIKNLFINNVKISINNIDLNENTVNFNVVFTNGKPILRNKVLKFEKNIEDFLDKKISEHFIKLVDEEKLLKYPDYDLKITDFEIVDSSRFKLLNIELVDKVDYSSDSVNYKFDYMYNDSIEFSKVHNIKFAESRIFHSFKNLSINDIDISFLENVNVQYYENRMKKADFKSQWISIDRKDLDKLIIKTNFDNDLIVGSVKFKRVQLFTKEEVPFKMVVFSKQLNRELLFDFSVKINNKKEWADFERLSGNDIKFVNPALQDSFPIPLLDVIDFKIKDPFRITNIFVKYNEKVSIVNCEFEISYIGLKKYVKKEIYFSNSHIKSINEKLYQENLATFENLTKKDILVSYDADTRDYYIKQDVQITVRNCDFYFIKLNDWELLNKNGKVKLDIIVALGNKERKFSKIITYNNKLSKDEFLEWREANYEPGKK